MSTDKAFDIQQLDNQIIVLDFWYSACYPCIKSIPVVNKIDEKFRKKGVVVFGVNMIDDELENKSRMEKYVRNNPMRYPTIMVDRELYETWVLNGYPMLLILDSNYQMIHTHIGFTENMEEELTGIIQEHLDD